MLAETESYLQLMEDLRGQIRALIADLPAEALNWRPIADSDDHAMNSLAVLAAHVAGAEHFWIGEVIGKLPPTRDRAAEFEVAVADTAVLLNRLDAVGKQTRTVLTQLTAADLESTRQIRDKTAPVRWGILHVIDHTALHLGHMQITYQLWHNGKGTNGPRWFHRLPA